MTLLTAVWVAGLLCIWAANRLGRRLARREKP